MVSCFQKKGVITQSHVSNQTGHEAGIYGAVGEGEGNNAENQLCSARQTAQNVEEIT